MALWGVAITPLDCGEARHTSDDAYVAMKSVGVATLGRVTELVDSDATLACIAEWVDSVAMLAGDAMIVLD